MNGLILLNDNIKIEKNIFTMIKYKQFNMSMYNFDFVNFDESSNESNSKENKNTNENIESLYKINNIPIIYDSTTMEFYRILRKNKLEVFTREPVNEKQYFKFEYQWDPYTGERKDKDPYGALYFHPDNLIYHFYSKRLEGLWVEPKDEANGFYTGYYDYFIGAGENIEIIGRGCFPELYLFRLPIPDCYLTKDNNMSVVTMGPKLTDGEIELIDKLAEKYFKNNYKIRFNKQRPILKFMKQLYDQALNNNLCNTMKDEDILRTNRDAVDLLKNL